MTPDILEQLRGLRPDDAGLDRCWPAADRTHLAALIRSGETGPALRLRHRPRSRRGRLVAAATVVTAAAAAAVAVPVLLPAGTPGGASPAAAAALHRLARVAADAPLDVAAPGQFVHTVVREHRIGVEDTGTNPPPTDTTVAYQQWRAADGRLWQRSGPADDPHAETLLFPASAGDAAYVASLPTGAGDLGRALRAHASGSDSPDEAVFVAVGDLLREQDVPAALRAAAVTVLAATPRVTLGPATRDSLGRPVQELDYVEGAARPGVVETLFLDPVTAQLLDERTTQPALTVTSSVVSDIVDVVPADVLRSAVAQP